MISHAKRVDADLNRAPGATGTELHTVSSLAAKHPGLTPGGIRWAIFNANENGLTESGALVRMGRKVLLDEHRFLDWLRSNSAKKAA